MPHTDILHDFHQGALGRAPLESFSPRSVFGTARLRGLLVVARSLLTVAKKSGGPSKGYRYARRRLTGILNNPLCIIKTRQKVVHVTNKIRIFN